MFPNDVKRAIPGKSNQNETIANLLTSPMSQQFYAVPPISPLQQPLLQVHSPIHPAIVPQLPITPGSIHNQASRAKQQQQTLQQLKIQTSYPTPPILTNQPRNRPVASVAPVTPSTPSTSALVTELNSTNNNASTNNTVFFSEISNIMRGFGDCETPLNDSIILIEKILLQQLRSILQDAIEIAVRRKQVPAPTKKDFEFLMRKHKVKLQRLRKYLKDLTYFKKHVRHIYGNQYPDYNDPDNTFEDESEDSDPEPVEKYDEEKVRRLFRADRISQVLNDQQYQDYHVARRASFLCRNNNVMKSRMRSWLSVPQDVRLTPTCLDILSFLAHETIATLVDYCILSRLNSSNRLTEPYSRLTSTIAHNVMHLCPEVSQGRAQDGVKPITVQEINEAMRRHNTMALKRTRLGTSFRGDCSNYKIPYLAI